MGSAVSSGTVAFLSLFAVCSMVAGATGIVITTTAADGSLEDVSGIDTSHLDIESSFDSADSIDDESIDGTADSLEEGSDETSETVDESTDESTVGDDETATETSDAIDETSTDATEAVAGTSDGTNDTADSVDDPIDSVNETTETVQNTTNETTGGLDERVDETSDALEDTIGETTDEIDGVTNGTVDEADSFLEKPVDSTTDALESAAGGAADTISSPISPVASVQIPGTDVSVSSVVVGESVLGAVAGGAPTDPGTGQIAADAVLVGLMGAMTASAGAAGGIGAAGGAIGGAGSGAAGGAGAAASSGLAAGASGAGAAGGAGGASGGLAGGASSAVANWSASGRRSLRRALAVIPWELIPILKYSRYDDSDPLENETRNAIYETLEADPGRYLSQISDEIDVPLSTVRHHVRVLEEEDLLTTVKINGKRRYYLEEIDSELQAALEEPAKRDVLEALATLERANNSELAAELDRDPSTVTHHLSTLEDGGLVVREREGRSIVNELAPETSAALFEEENTTLEDPSPQAPAD